MSKDLITHVNVTSREPMPTPLMVTQAGQKSVMLKFNTQEEADVAWRILSALAEAHANRTWAERDALNNGPQERTNRHLQIHQHEPSSSQHMLAMDSRHKR